jgi:hypothetical protein
MWKKSQRGKYRNRVEFLGDVQLIVKNCHDYCTTRYPSLPPVATLLLSKAAELIHSTPDDWWAEREEFRLPPPPPGASAGMAAVKGRKKGKRGGFVKKAVADPTVSSTPLPAPSPLLPPSYTPLPPSLAVSEAPLSVNPSAMEVDDVDSPPTPVFVEGDEGESKKDTTPIRVLSDSDSDATPLLPYDSSDETASLLPSSSPKATDFSPLPLPALTPSSSTPSSSSSSASESGGGVKLSLKIRFTHQKNTSS